MVAESKIPESIKKYVPCKCCRIRKDGDTYRVYKYKSVKSSVTGKWTSDGGILIGKIIEDKGFIPNKRYLKEFAQVNTSEATNVFDDSITDVSYGSYALIKFLSEDILERLEKYFGQEQGTQIYCYGLIMCVNGFTYIDQIDDYYQESFMSVIFKNFSFKMGYTALSTLLRELGKKGNRVKAFEQSLIDESSKSIAIDGHVIRSCSEENDLAEPGYKMNLLKSEQVNLLVAYDTKNNAPLLYRTFRGSSIDKKSVIELLESRKFSDTKFIVDRGFYSKTVLNMMSSNGNSYIIPVTSKNSDFVRIKENLQYTSGEFIYSSGRKECARVVFYEEKISETQRMIIFKDLDENNSNRKSFLKCMDENEKGYTMEKYNEVCEYWGVLAIETNVSSPAHEIYNDYKKRWSIETFNNYIKNDAHFNNLKIQDYYIQHGFDFIMLITGMLHSKLNEAVKNLGKSNISTFDILLKAGHMRMIKQDKIWKLCNTRKKDLELLEKINFVPDHQLTVN